MSHKSDSSFICATDTGLGVFKFERNQSHSTPEYILLIDMKSIFFPVCFQWKPVSSTKFYEFFLYFKLRYVLRRNFQHLWKLLTLFYEIVDRFSS